MTLPPRTRTLLLTAAADPTNSPSLLWRAGSELGFGTKDVAAAEDRHVLVVRDSVKFRHPLIRSALYYAATLAARVKVHAALAAATGELGSVDQRAWHLAAAATEPDEAVAAELERVAARTRDRGGLDQHVEPARTRGDTDPRSSSPSPTPAAGGGGRRPRWRWRPAWIMVTLMPKAPRLWPVKWGRLRY